MKWQKDLYPEVSNFTDICIKPKTGFNPYYQAPYDEKWGTDMHEKMFLGSDELPGCFAVEDWTHELGDQNEKLIVTALRYRATNNCSKAPSNDENLGLKTTAKAHFRPDTSNARKVYERRPLPLRLLENELAN